MVSTIYLSSIGKKYCFVKRKYSLLYYFIEGSSVKSVEQKYSHWLEHNQIRDLNTTLVVFQDNKNSIFILIISELTSWMALINILFIWRKCFGFFFHRKSGSKLTSREKITAGWNLDLQLLLKYVLMWKPRKQKMNSVNFPVTSKDFWIFWLRYSMRKTRNLHLLCHLKWHESWLHKLPTVYF